MKDKTEVLQHELDEIRARIFALEVALEDKPDYGLGTGASGVTRWELDGARLQRLKQRAASLEQAILRANGSTYRLCAQCGRPIHPDRVAVLPDTTICVRCARADDHKPSTSQPDALGVDS